MHEYYLARKVLMADASGVLHGKGSTEIRLDEWCEGRLRQQRDDCGAWLQTEEGLESLYAYDDDCILRGYFCLGSSVL